MLDPKFVYENLDLIETTAQKKRFSFDKEAFKGLFESRLKLLEEVESLRKLRNEGSDEIKKEKDASKRQSMIEKMKEALSSLSEKEKALAEVEERFHDILLRAPNILAPETPDGHDDSDNVELERVGTPRSFHFKPLDHIELCKKLKLADFERGTQIAGSRSFVLTHKGARLERAVHSLALDVLYESGFEQLSVPVLVKKGAMEGTGYLPLGADQAYYIEKDDLYLVGTSEVPLTSFYQNEIFDEKDLPIKLCGWSQCFRREAGSHGKDTKGLYRVHQFQKIEQVIICAPSKEKSDKCHKELLDNAQKILTLLELPYRIVQVCAGDLGQGQVKKNDIETWMPSRNHYGETHSCSSFYDFQARRLKIRVRDEQTGKPKFAYTLNNTAVATPRVLIPLLENHQTEDGRIYIPKALRKYMGDEEYLD
jgi:seryl-tRNA synthetase